MQEQLRQPLIVASTPVQCRREDHDVPERRVVEGRVVLGRRHETGTETLVGNHDDAFGVTTGNVVEKFHRPVDFAFVEL